MNQLFYNIDIIISNFGFSKPIEGIQTCVSMASLRPQRAQDYDLKIMEHADDLSQLRDFAGCKAIIICFNVFSGCLAADESLHACLVYKIVRRKGAGRQGYC